MYNDKKLFVDTLVWASLGEIYTYSLANVDHLR